MTDKERAKDFVETIINNPLAIIRWCKREMKTWNMVANDTYDKNISDWALLQKESYRELIKLIEEEMKMTLKDNCENILYRQTALDSAIKNNPVMSKSVEKRVLVQIQDIAKSLNLHCKMEDEHE